MNQDDWPHFFTFDALMDRIYQFCKLLLNFRVRSIDKAILGTEITKLLGETTQNIVALIDRTETAHKCLETSNKKSLDRIFSPLQASLSLLINIVIETEEIIATFEEDSREIPKFINELTINLSEITKALKIVYESSVWNVILGIELRSYECSMPIFETEFTDFRHYLDFGKEFDLENELFLEIERKVMDPVKSVFVNGKFRKPENVGHFSAIIGPSFMGKTQFSFALARKYPVLYLNLMKEPKYPQEIYKCFYPLKDELSSVLSLDETTLLSKKKELKGDDRLHSMSSSFIFLNPELKLYTIGFIWNLVEYSTTFDVNSGEEWFSYYLKDRIVTYESLSLNMFWDRMSKPWLIIHFETDIFYIL